MKLIGLTGGIATGKSTVSKALRDLGMCVIDADELAREVVEPHTFGLISVVENFGIQILKSNGVLDRSKLGEIIFSDRESRERLERITHPLIQWRSLQEQGVCRGRGDGLVFYDAALIYEKDLVGQFDSVVVVHTSSETQIKRMLSRDKISSEEAGKRIQSQIPISEKVKRADFLIDNEGSIEMTRHQVSQFIEKLKTIS